MDNSFQQVITQLPKWFSTIAEAVPQEERQMITELRLFEGQPAFWCCGRQGRTYDTHKLTAQQLRELFSAVCRKRSTSIIEEFNKLITQFSNSVRIFFAFNP